MRDEKIDLSLIDIHPGAFVHPSTLLGYGAIENDSPVRILAGARVEAFCVIEPGAVIGQESLIYHHCVIGRDAYVGHRTKLVDRARIAARAIVGDDCIIGSNISERVVVGNRVTFMGEMAHSHTNASLDWDTTDEVSPVIEDGCVIAQGALIIGGICIGKNSYISAGQIVKTDVPPDTLVVNGKMRPISRWRGIIRARG